MRCREGADSSTWRDRGGPGLWRLTVIGGELPTREQSSEGRHVGPSLRHCVHCESGSFPAVVQRSDMLSSGGGTGAVAQSWCCSVHTSLGLSGDEIIFCSQFRAARLSHVKSVFIPCQVGAMPPWHQNGHIPVSIVEILFFYTLAAAPASSLPPLCIATKMQISPIFPLKGVADFTWQLISA